ncbi:MAG: hypothetical protein ACOX8U_09635 [Bradymonadia bacterium]|jgi:hypothetical protein
MKKFLFFIAAFSLTFLACDDNDARIIVCKNDQTKCVRQQVSVCTNGAWAPPIACPENQLCDAVEQKCKEGGQPPHECEGDSQVCDIANGLHQRWVCVDGTYQPFDCKADEVCVATSTGVVSCKECIVENEKKCRGNNIVECSGGVWNTIHECREACKDSSDEGPRCDDPVPSDCTEANAGQKRCSADKSSIEICQNLAWVSQPCTPPTTCIASGDDYVCDELPALYLESLSPSAANVAPGSSASLVARLNAVAADPTSIHLSASGEACDSSPNSVVVAAEAQESSFDVSIKADAQAGQTCEVTATLTESYTSTLTVVSESDCVQNEKRCKAGKLETCTESGLWSSALVKNCPAGYTCPEGVDGINSCQIIEIVEVSPSEVYATHGVESVEITITLNYPVYDPPFTISLDPTNFTGMSSIVYMPSSTFDITGGEQSGKFTFVPSGSHSNPFKITVKGPNNDPDPKAIIVHYDPPCSEYTTKCLGHLVQTCTTEGKWDIPKLCPEISSSLGNSHSSCYVQDDVGKCGLTNLLRPFGTHGTKGKRIKVKLGFKEAAISYASSIKAVSEDSSKLLPIHEVGANTGDALLLPSGTQHRVMALEVLDDGVAPVVTYTDSYSGSSVSIDYKLIPCVTGDKRCQVIQNVAHQDLCTNGTWNSNTAQPTCGAEEVCSLYTSECEKPRIEQVFPNIIVMNSLVHQNNTIVIDLNGPRDIAQTLNFEINGSTVSKNIPPNTPRVTYPLNSNLLDGLSNYIPYTLKITLGDSEETVTIIKI